MRYYVLYVEECEPKLKSFVSKSALKKFIIQFEGKHKKYYEDSHIDIVFNSDKVEVYDEHYSQFIDKA